MNADLSTAVYHDLKNRLALLTDELSRLRVLSVEPEARAHAEAAQAQTSALTMQLRGLLVAQTAASGRLPVAMDAQNPGELLEDLAADARLLAAERLRIDLAVNEAPPLWFIDNHLMRLALDSALYNALRFAVEVITLGLRMDEEGMLVFAIADDGPGVQKKSTPGPSSTGLGLTVCHEVARVHRNKGREGYCTLKNCAERGAVFEMHLP